MGDQVMPTFINVGSNIAVQGDNRTARWQFTESFGTAFSAESLVSNRTYKIILRGRGHAAIGLCNTDPTSIIDINEATKSGQIKLIYDISSYTRDQEFQFFVRNMSGIVYLLETPYNLEPTRSRYFESHDDVWLVVYLKFGEISAQLKKFGYWQYLKFHSNAEQNIALNHTSEEISLRTRIPHAHVDISRALYPGEILKIRVSHIQPKDPPAIYHVGVALKSSVDSRKISPVTILAASDSIGDIEFCLSDRRMFEIVLENGKVITENTMGASSVFIQLEIFRVKVSIIDVHFTNRSKNGMRYTGSQTNSRGGSREAQTPLYNRNTDVMRGMRVNGSSDQHKAPSAATVTSSEHSHRGTPTVGGEGNIAQTRSEAPKEASDEKAEFLRRINYIQDEIDRLRNLLRHKYDGPLDDHQFKLHIDSNFDAIVDNLSDLPRLCHKLLDSGVIAPSKHHEFIDKHLRDQKEGNKQLVLYLRKIEKNENIMQKIKDAIVKSKQYSLLPHRL